MRGWLRRRTSNSKQHLAETTSGTAGIREVEPPGTDLPRPDEDAGSAPPRQVTEERTARAPRSDAAPAGDWIIDDSGAEGNSTGTDSAPATSQAQSWHADSERQTAMTTMTDEPGTDRVDLSAFSPNPPQRTPWPSTQRVPANSAPAVERERLIELCLYALDRARSEGVAHRLIEGLSEVGVHALRPDGERFDPTHHEASGTVRTADVTVDGVIAETEVPGFADRDRVLRAPVVTVYRAAREAG